MLFSEPKIPQSAARRMRRDRATRVSVLFSEPKIPQFGGVRVSAGGSAGFQCSSASRKFLNALSGVAIGGARIVSVLFSEPKIPQSNCSIQTCELYWFQCSSASRKFLNGLRNGLASVRNISFSALQRAENSSIIIKQQKAE